MKVVIFGASGIIGQHMLLARPVGVDVYPIRRIKDGIFQGCDLSKWNKEGIFGKGLAWDYEKPDVVVNLAGDSDTDSVAVNEKARWLNVDVPMILSRWCEENGARYIHISTQAVFDGLSGPYRPNSPVAPVNKYGQQKADAERLIMRDGLKWSVIRPTFVLGVRPLPNCGRRNPVETLLGGSVEVFKNENGELTLNLALQRDYLMPRLVNDRWFSPLFAEDAAKLIWKAIQFDPPGTIIHLGIPRRTSRYDVAKALGVEAEPVSHDSFPGIEPRPIDTTYYAGTTRETISWEDGIQGCKRAWESRRMRDLEDHATEIALFLGINKDVALERLRKGFGFQHNEVAVDFRRADTSTDEKLLEWYRTTEAYIWELSAYHCDSGFNYRGMCRGIAEGLSAHGAKRVLVLGDGIGELTLSLREAGFDATYHDLAGSKTARFAEFRFERHGQTGESLMSQDFVLVQRDMREFDAVVSCDFLEHVPNVDEWATQIRSWLKPGGVFIAQNAFGIGSGERGSIPMHLACNDRFEKDWDPLLAELGFEQLASQWYRKPAGVAA